MSVKPAHAGHSQRALYPPSCAINPSCTVAVVSTVAGTRAYALADTSGTRAGPSVQSLHPPLPTAVSSATPGMTSAAASAPVTTATAAATNTTAAASPPSALWHTPVYTATIADDCPLVAVVFRARPQVFAPTTLSMAEGVQEAEAASGLPSPGASADDVTTEDTEEGADEEAEEPCPSPPPPTDPAAFTARAAAELECRRYVYLFEATTGTCLAALHFSGSPVLALRANAAVLLVAAVDLFHLVDLRTLRYVRQHSMYKPLNPRGVLDLSAVVVPRGQSTGTYAVAFPQLARGYKGDVTVLRLHSPVATPTTATAALAAAARNSSSPSAAAGRTHAPSTQQRTIPAHHHAIAQLRFRHDGRLLATASELGTTVKLFDCATGALLVELQRGHRPASVLSLAVQRDGSRIAALSANGTLHVFDCTAVVRAWEARAAAGPTAASPSSRAAGGTAGAAVSKLRAESRHKVALLHNTDVVAPRRADERSGDGATAAAEAGRVHTESGFTPDSRAVWVAQVESTEAQRQREAAALAQAPVPVASVNLALDASARSVRLCVGSITRIPLPPLAPERDIGGAGSSLFSSADRGEEVCHYVVV